MGAFTHTIRSLTNGGSTTDAASFNTASITSQVNELMLCVVGNSHASAATLPTITSWTQVATVTFGTSYRLTMFRRQSGTVVTGAQTISFGGTTQTGCRWQIVGFPQATVDTANNGAAAVVQSPTNTATAAALTINYTSTVARTSAGYIVILNSGATAVTPRTNWSESLDTTHATPSMGIETQRRLILNNETAGGTATSITGAGILVEVKLNLASIATPETAWRRRFFPVLGR